MSRSLHNWGILPTSGLFKQRGQEHAPARPFVRPSTRPFDPGPTRRSAVDARARSAETPGRSADSIEQLRGVAAFASGDETVTGSDGVLVTEAWTPSRSGRLISKCHTCKSSCFCNVLWRSEEVSLGNVNT